MTSRNTAIFLLTLFSIARVEAADCKKEKLDDGEQLSSYLREYSRECVKQQVDSRLKRWGIDSPSGPMKKDPKRDETNVSMMLPAWGEISAGLGKLADEAMSAADGDSKMKEIYRQLAERASVARSELALSLQKRLSPDISAFRGEAWRIQPQMFLPALGRAGEPIMVGKALNDDCSNRDSSLCQHTLRQGRELMLQWKLAERISGVVSASTIRDVAERITAKDALWNRYLYDSKPMLPFDFILTDLLEGRWKGNDPYPGGFPVPPKTQWFLLHPAFGVEYASAAADGQQMKPVVYVEVFGANRWSGEDRWFDLPVLRYFSGFSLIVSYADRAGIKDTGYGALLTFDNVYSLGLTRYGRDKGLFLSLDLANLYRDKLRPRYEASRRRLDNLFRLP